MHKIKIILIMVFFVVLFLGCSTPGSIRSNSDNSRELNKIKSVSVGEFKCSDPDRANNIRNMIIDSLLTHYSVIIGSEADVLIKGSITLSGDQVASASPGSRAVHITEINAQLMKNKKVFDSVTVTQVSNNISYPAADEGMGRDMGEKIKKSLSHILP